MRNQLTCMALAVMAGSGTAASTATPSASAVSEPAAEVTNTPAELEKMRKANEKWMAREAARPASETDWRSNPKFQAKSASERAAIEQEMANAQKRISAAMPPGSGVAGVHDAPSVAPPAKAVPQPAPAQVRPDPNPPGWYGWASGVPKIDREGELRGHVGSFKRVGNAGGSFNDLCQSIGKRCSKVMDWEGHPQSCSSGHDGSRVAFCQ